jgi:hypothetical protein
MCAVRVPTPDAATALLEQTAGPVERAALQRVLRLLRAATEPAVLAKNGVTSAVDLCMAMTYHLMPQLTDGGCWLPRGRGSGSSRAACGSGSGPAGGLPGRPWLAA